MDWHAFIDIWSILGNICNPSVNRNNTSQSVEMDLYSSQQIIVDKKNILFTFQTFLH